MNVKERWYNNASYSHFIKFSGSLFVLNSIVPDIELLSDS